MALNPHQTAAQRKLMLDAIIASFNSGIIRVYSGTQPADADAAVGAGTLLAELTLNATAFSAPAAVASTAYTVTANAITADASANASGTPAWARIFASNGTTPLMDCTCGLSGTDLIINASPISSGAPVSATSLTLTLAV